MDYMQEDPYSSHRFAPHDPYYSGGGGGGGGYDGNYANNTSFDRQSDHSIHSDRNRPVKNYQDIPNGAPYGSSSNLRQSQSDLMMRASPQPPRSLSPQDYPPPPPPQGSGDVRAGGPHGGAGYGHRESPYHNLPPYQAEGPDNYEEYGDDIGPGPDYYDDDDSRQGHVVGDPRSGDYQHPPSEPPHHFPYDEDLHDGGYGQR